MNLKAVYGKALKRELHTKFSYHCSGRVGRITRYIGPYFGSAQVFAMDYYNEYADKEQLLISKFKDFYREVEAPETTADRQAMREAAGKTK